MPRQVNNHPSNQYFPLVQTVENITPTNSPQNMTGATTPAFEDLSNNLNPSHKRKISNSEEHESANKKRKLSQPDMTIRQRSLPLLMKIFSSDSIFNESSFLMEIADIKECIEDDEFRNSLVNSNDIEMHDQLGRLESIIIKNFNLIQDEEDKANANSVIADLNSRRQLIERNSLSFKKIIKNLKADVEIENLGKLFSKLELVSKDFHELSVVTFADTIDKKKLPLIDIGLPSSSDAIKFAIKHQLKHIDLSGYTDLRLEDINHLIEENKNILSLLLDCNGNFEGDDVNITELPNLQKLSIKNLSNFNQDISNLKQLMHLQLINLQSSQPNLSNLSNLQFLELKHISDYNPDLNQLIKLQTLLIADCTGFNQNLSHLIELKHLKLSNISCTQDLSNLNQLETLSVSSLSRFNQDLSQFVKLKKLSLEYLPDDYNPNLLLLDKLECLSVNYLKGFDQKLDHLYLLKKLNLSQLSEDYLPDLSNLHCLEELKLFALPHFNPDLSSNIHLQHLSVHRLDSFSQELGHLKNLKKLKLSYIENDYNPDLSQLIKLNTLYLERLGFNRDLGDLIELERLELVTLPDNFNSDLSRLCKLKHLSISYSNCNPILNNLEKLERLELISLPEDYNPNLNEFKNLKTLVVEDLKGFSQNLNDFINLKHLQLSLLSEDYNPTLCNLISLQHLIIEELKGFDQNLNHLKNLKLFEYGGLDSFKQDLSILYAAGCHIQSLD